MKRWGTWILLALLILAATPVAAADADPPIAFEDPGPVQASWPNAIRAAVINKTSQTVTINVQLTSMREPESGSMVRTSDFWQPVPQSVAIPPSAKASLTLAVNDLMQPSSGDYTGELLISMVGSSTVLRKPVNIAVTPESPANSIAAAGGPAPAVSAWTLNAIRILPFARPICARGLSFGCSLPLASAEMDVGGDPVVVGHLINELGGGMVVKTVGTDTRRGARLGLAFDRRWGYAGVYTGTVNLTDGAKASEEAAGNVALTVHVKDLVVWPLGVLWLGIVLARRSQHYVTVRRQTFALLGRLNDAALTFAKLRKSVHGYTVADSFQARKQTLEEEITTWDRHHSGHPTTAESQALERVIVAPLTELEADVATWAQFRQKLDRLARKLLQEAYPAIQKAQVPGDVDLEEPRFYTAGRQLLRGSKLQMRQVQDYAQRIDDLAELAGAWPELERLGVLVRDAIAALSAPDIVLSSNEQEMLEAARHHVNSASRDLWEAHSLADLKARETGNELRAAQELTRRLMDPFVTQVGEELVAHLGIDEDEIQAAARDHGASFPVRVLSRLHPVMRTYARLDALRLPRLDFDAYHGLSDDAARAAYVRKASLIGERAITVLATVVALLVGLERYFTTDFGSTADYLALFTSGLVSKVGLEVVNAVLSRLLPSGD